MPTGSTSRRSRPATAGPRSPAYASREPCAHNPSRRIKAAASPQETRLFTVCPKCTLTLVVTTVDLRAGQGYVRCGRCSNVFNALIALREGDPANGTSDPANRRLQETAPKSINPAPGVGVVMDPEPEPEAE